MKTGGAVVAAALALAGMLAAGPQPVTARTGPPAAEIVSMQAPVEIGTPTSERWRPARTGDRLAAGESVRTGWGGRVELEVDGARVRLYENSAFRLPGGMAPADAQQVHLDAGAALFDVDGAGRQRRFEVRTPEAVAAVQGTRFGVRSEGGRISLLVYEGSVSLASEQRASVLVRAGFGASARDGSPFELGVIDRADPWGAWGRPDATLPRLEPAEALDRSAARAAREAMAAPEADTGKRRPREGRDRDPALGGLDDPPAAFGGRGAFDGKRGPGPSGGPASRAFDVRDDLRNDRAQELLEDLGDRPGLPGDADDGSTAGSRP